MTNDTNRQIVFAQRPDDRLGVEHFETRVGPIPSPGAHELLVRTVLTTVAPAQRAWIQGPTYRDQLAEGEVMPAFGIGEVLNGPTAGNLVIGDIGWQEYGVLPIAEAAPIGADFPPAQQFSLFGISALSAYFGMIEHGRPVAGETVLVSAAAGAVGHIAGQLARIAGGRVIGITGSAEKNRVLTEQLGYDAAVNRRSPTFAEDLAAACGDGVDLFFDNVGGEILNTALPLMAMHGRIVCCGVMSTYDSATQQRPGPAGVPLLLITRRLRMSGFIVLDHADRWDEARAALGELWAGGQLRTLEDVRTGLEAAPAALVGMLNGENLGQMLIQVR
jgi:NADPH-dependent curcumin reductase CurA